MEVAGRRASTLILSTVFLVSGVAAVLYQLVWQRTLFRLYGTDAESVTLVVTAFMLGLGLGSLAGGRLSMAARLPLPALFAAAEAGIGLYGLASLAIFDALASVTAGGTGLQVGIYAFTAVFIPTLLMGATLPILVAHHVRESANVGHSVGLLYAVNTLGSAAGCLLAALFLLGALGQRDCVRVAAGLNGAAAAGSLLLWRRRA
jgi:predicted membrane-bound spermidine synthase